MRGGICWRELVTLGLKWLVWLRGLKLRSRFYGDLLQISPVIPAISVISGLGKNEWHCMICIAFTVLVLSKLKN